jgi:hypothetical protein
VLTKHTAKHQTNAWVTLTRPLAEAHKQTVQQEKQIQKDEGKVRLEMQASPDVPTNTQLNPKPKLNYMLMNAKSSSRNIS